MSQTFQHRGVCQTQQKTAPSPPPTLDVHMGCYCRLYKRVLPTSFFPLSALGLSEKKMDDAQIHFGPILCIFWTFKTPLQIQSKTCITGSKGCKYGHSTRHTLDLFYAYFGLVTHHYFGLVRYHYKLKTCITGPKGCIYGQQH